MKKFSKLLALLLALVMAVSCFTACGKNNDAKDDETKSTESANKPTDDPAKEPGKEPEKNNDEEDIKDTVSGFFDTFFAGEFDSLSDYTTEEIDGDEVINAMFADVDFSDLENGIAELEAIGVDSSEVDDFMADLMAKVFGSFTYTIDKVKLDGDEAKVIVTITSPDFDSIDFENIDIESAIDIESIAADFMAESGYTQSELANMSEAELQAALLEYMLPNLFDALSKLMSEEIDNAPTTSEEIEINVEKPDDEWLIVIE